MFVECFSTFRIEPLSTHIKIAAQKRFASEHLREERGTSAVLNKNTSIKNASNIVPSNEEK